MTDAELQTAFEVALQLIQHLNTALQRGGQLESLVFRKVVFFVRHLHYTQHLKQIRRCAYMYDMDPIARRSRGRGMAMAPTDSRTPQDGAPPRPPAHPHT